MVCGWAGSLGATDGINIVGGTGSMTYGERQSIGARVGGWGELFEDEGSAHWIAVDGLNAFSRMSDGRLARGPLFDLAKRHLEVDLDLEIIGVVFNKWNKEHTQIAAVAKTISEAAATGNPVATEILEQAGVAFANLVDTTRVKLGFESGGVVPVSYSGSIFKSDVVFDSFARALHAKSDDLQLRTPRYQPDFGATLYAAKISGSPLIID